MPPLLQEAFEVEALARSYGVLPSEVVHLSPADFAYNQWHMALLRLAAPDVPAPADVSEWDDR